LNDPTSRSFFRRFGRAAAATAAMLAIAGCGAARASSGPTGTSTTAARPAKASVATKKPSRAVATINHLTAAAKQVYANEIHGTNAIRVLHRVGRDATLLRLLASHNLSGARTYVYNEYWHVWYHWHVSRMRIWQGSHKVSEIGVPFVIPASHLTLRASGRNVGTLSVSMQDEIGVVRLLHRMHPSLQVLIRGSGGELRTSLRSAASVKLPSSGAVTIGGLRYLVRSFGEPAWGGETVTIWLLMRG
jgi:hypothetical protein